MGSSDIYRLVEDFPEIRESLIVGLDRPNGGYFMPLFVVLEDGVSLDDNLKARISQRLREQVSPNHVPDDIIAIPAVPRTLNGKKLEVPIKKLLLGVPVAKAVNIDSIANPEAIEFFVRFAAQNT